MFLILSLNPCLITVSNFLFACFTQFLMNAHAGSVTADEEVVNKSDSKGMYSIVSCDNRTFPLIAVPDSGFVELLLAPQSSDDVSFGCIMENV